MTRECNNRGIVVGLVLSLAMLSTGIWAGQPAEKHEETVAQRILKARTNRDPEVQIAAVRSLGQVSKEEASDNKVVEVLLDIVKSSNDLFVRIAAINALGQLQLNVTRDDRAKIKYRDPFVALLKNKEEHAKIRAAVADVFRQTLESKGSSELPDTEAFKSSVLVVARDKAEPNLSLRKNCILAIGQFGRPENIAVLADILAEPENNIRAAAAEAIEALLVNSKDVQIPVPTVNKLVEIVSDSRLAIPLRISVMKAVAQLARDGNTTARTQGYPAILALADFQTSKDNDMVLAAVEALGIIGSAEAVAPLVKTYNMYFDKDKPTNPKDVPVRKAVVKAMIGVLKTQNEARTPDMRAVKGAVDLLVKVLDEDKAPEVKNAAVFTLRYLYPKKFEAEQKVPVLALIQSMQNSKDDAYDARVAETLEFITEVNYGSDGEKWMDWFTKKYKIGAPGKK